MNKKFQVGDLVRVLVIDDDPTSARAASFAFRTLAPYNSVGLVLGFGEHVLQLGLDVTTYVTVLVDGERSNFTPDEITKIGETNE